MTRVLIVDDHPVFRDGLAGLLATLPGIEVAGAAGTAEQALAAIRQTAPDVVLMDINLRLRRGGDPAGRPDRPGHRRARDHYGG